MEFIFREHQLMTYWKVKDENKSQRRNGRRFLLDNELTGKQRIDHERVIPWYLPGVLIFVCQQNEIEDLITDHRSPTCVSECLLLSFVSSVC